MSSALPPATLFSLEGKVAIVTGSAGGIGSEISKVFSAAGASVVLADRNSAALATTVAGLERPHMTVAYDQADPASIQRLIDQTLERFGQLDVLVKCAATFGFEPFEATTVETWDRIHSVNLRGAALCCKSALPAMLARGGGAIVNISSIASVRTVLYSNVAYATAKGGMNALTTALAAEYGTKNIRVNAVLPGAIQIDAPEATIDPAQLRGPLLTPGRILLANQGPGLPVDIAAASLFLASDAARYVTGQLLVVDGGLSLS